MKTYILFIFVCILFNDCIAQSTNVNVDECKQRIIDEGLEVGLVLDNRYIINGHIDTIPSANLIRMSFFRLMDCKTGENIVDKFFCTEKNDYNFSLPFNAQIKKDGSNLEIIHFGRLPLGDNWNLIDVPVYKQTILFNTDTIYRISEECIFKPQSISKQKYKDVLLQYEALKSSKNIKYMDTDSVAMITLKLFLCSLQDYSDCKEYFLNLEEEIPGATDGMLSEIYWRWFGFYHLYKKLPLPEKIVKN